MNLFAEIEFALARIKHGWCSHRKAQTLAATVLALRPSMVVEIGVYAGRSFLPMAMALKQIGAGRAVGIDPYDAMVSSAGENDANSAWWGSLDHEEIFRQMVAAKDWLQLGPWVEIIREPSDDVSPPDAIGVLHIDGGHTDVAVRDALRFAPQVEVGGFCVLDDILWDSGAPSASAEILRDFGFVERYTVIGPEPGTRFSDNWGVYQRVRS